MAEASRQKEQWILIKLNVNLEHPETLYYIPKLTGPHLSLWFSSDPHIVYLVTVYICSWVKLIQCNSSEEWKRESSKLIFSREVHVQSFFWILQTKLRMTKNKPFEKQWKKFFHFIILDVFLTSITANPRNIIE